MGRLLIVSDSFARARCVAALFLLPLLLGACGTEEGIDPYSLWKTYEHPAKGFHFHYPDPPWEKGEEYELRIPVLVLDEHAEASDDEPGAAVRLTAWLEPGMDPATLISNRQDLWGHAHYELTPPEICSNGADDDGVLLKAQRGNFWVREYVYSSGDSCAVLTMWGDEKVDNSDLDLLAESFEPRGAKE